MALSKDNKRIVGTVTNKEYEEIEKLATKESRTISNMVVKLVREGLKVIKNDKS